MRWPRARPWLSFCQIVALGAIAAGEKLAEETARPGLWILGGLIAATAAVLRLAAARRLEDPAERRLELWLGAAMAAGAALVPIAALRVASVARALGVVDPAARHRLDTWGAAAISAVALLSLVPLVLADITRARQRGAARVEVRRIAEAARGGLVVAAALVVTALLVAGAARGGWAVDGSSDRGSLPGESTRRALADLAKPVRAVAFFDPRGEVGPRVVDFLRELEGSRLQIQNTSRVRDPRVAAELGVEADGVLVLTTGGAIERVVLGEEPRGPAVRGLDSRVQLALLRLARPARAAYLTSGHGEAAWGQTGAPGRRLEKLRALLVSQNLEPRELGLSGGLGAAIPADAAMVLVVAPSGPFAAEELAALRVYVDRGGRLLLAVDPDAGGDPAPLLALVGLTATGDRVALEAAVARRRSDPSDRAILVITGDPERGGAIASHPSVASIARGAGRAKLALPGATPLYRLEDTAPGAGFVLSSDPRTFLDRDGDHERDEGEGDGPFQLAAAIERPSSGASPTRAFVIGDGDVLGDEALVSSETNALFALDVVRWLAGDERLAGAVESTADVRVVHTRRGDALWFWCAILGVPALVMVAAALAHRRARPTPPRPPRPAAPPAVPPG